MRWASHHRAAGARQEQQGASRWFRRRRAGGSSSGALGPVERLLYVAFRVRIEFDYARLREARGDALQFVIGSWAVGGMLQECDGGRERVKLGRVGLSNSRQQNCDAVSTQGCCTPCLNSRPAMAAGVLSEAGGLSSTVHQSACG